MALESFLTNDLTPSMVREVEEFLDSQETAHPFQFPQWVDPGSRLMLLRESGKICWLGTFSLYAPLGRKMPWIRAAVANRGPVCDDLKLWETAANELAEFMRRERLTYFEVSPEWIQRTEGPGLLSNSEWKSLDVQRASLRLDLTRSADEIFANFGKNTRYEVRRAERAGAIVSAATSDAEIGEFSHLYLGLAARKGFQPDSIERLRRQIHWLMNAESRGAAPVGAYRQCGSRRGRCGTGGTAMLVHLGSEREAGAPERRPHFAVDRFAVGEGPRLHRVRFWGIYAGGNVRSGVV